MHIDVYLCVCVSVLEWSTSWVLAAIILFLHWNFPILKSKRPVVVVDRTWAAAELMPLNDVLVHINFIFSSRRISESKYYFSSCHLTEWKDLSLAFFCMIMHPVYEIKIVPPSTALSGHRQNIIYACMHSRIEHLRWCGFFWLPPSCTQWSNSMEFHQMAFKFRL